MSFAKPEKRITFAVPKKALHIVLILHSWPKTSRSKHLSMMPKKTDLSVSPTPFRPSLLSIIPSPHSPLSPLGMLAKVAHMRPTSQKASPFPSSPSSSRRASTISTLTPLPAAAYPWIWQCHLCQTFYPLGATRRCLHDGHRFCTGELNDTNVRGERRRGASYRRRRRKPCSSEFDYEGWEVWGDWRRGEIAAREQLQSTAPYKKRRRSRTAGSAVIVADCTTLCDYPSECRRSNHDLRRKHRATVSAEVHGQDRQTTDTLADSATSSCDNDAERQPSTTVSAAPTSLEEISSISSERVNATAKSTPVADESKEVQGKKTELAASGT
ncbi:hypothetical protein FH972_023107 [Carpinus fangiana]|uniref:Uncharacterized protein n=1 Tax=Carpinus fangiana TaxID=176857 RepID=A0A5N6KWI0_9ROSI|nr:hypothetical protein FH972_023107 [Carpinus fangiana]